MEFEYLTFSQCLHLSSSVSSFVYVLQFSWVSFVFLLAKLVLDYVQNRNGAARMLGFHNTWLPEMNFTTIFYFYRNRLMLFYSPIFPHFVSQKIWTMFFPVLVSFGWSLLDTICKNNAHVFLVPSVMNNYIMHSKSF